MVAYHQFRCNTINLDATQSLTDALTEKLREMRPINNRSKFFQKVRNLLSASKLIFYEMQMS